MDFGQKNSWNWFIWFDEYIFGLNFLKFSGLLWFVLSFEEICPVQNFLELFQNLVRFKKPRCSRTYCRFIFFVKLMLSWFSLRRNGLCFHKKVQFRNVITVYLGKKHWLIKNTTHTLFTALVFHFWATVHLLLWCFLHKPLLWFSVFNLKLEAILFSPIFFWMKDLRSNLMIYCLKYACTLS